MKMANDARIPDFVREYLVYRGFSGSLKSFELDLKNEKDKGFRVDKIMEQIHLFINNYDLVNLRDFWKFLDNRFFTRVQHHFSSVIKKLEAGLLKAYLVNCVQSNKNDKITEFFEKLSPELQGMNEWRDWFALPFCRNPEENLVFSMYFTKQWQDTFFLSLHNLLSVIIQTSPAPKAFSSDEEVLKIKRLEEENKKLRNQIEELKNSKNPLSVETLNLSDNARDSILSPAGPMPGPTAMDLMDDFYVISQENIIEQSSQATTPVSKSQPIKTFIKNIGRSGTPAVDGKKQPQVVTANSDITVKSSQFDSQSSALKRSDASYNRSKSDPSKGSNTSGNNSNTSASSSASSNTSVNTGGGAKPKTGIPKGSSSSSQGKQLSTRSQAERPKSLDATAVTSGHSVTAGHTKGSSLPNKKPEVIKKSSSSTSQQQGISSTMSNSLNKNHVKASSPSNQTDNNVILHEQNINTEKCHYLLLSQDDYCEHRSPITHCRFSSTSHSVASLDADGVVKIWSLQPSPVTVSTIMSKSMLLSLDWASKLDKYILLGSRAGSVRLFDVTNKKIEKEANVDQTFQRVNNLCCNPQATHFACCSSGKYKQSVDSQAPTVRSGKLTIWNLETMQCQRTLSIGPVAVIINCSCYSQSGKFLLTGSADGFVRLYDVESDKDSAVSAWCAHQGEVCTVCFSQDETSCYSLGADGKLIEWSMNKLGEKLLELPIHSGASGPFVRCEPGGFRQVQTAKGKLCAFDYDQSLNCTHVLTCSQTGGLLYQLEAEGNSMEAVMLLGGHQTPVITLDYTTSHDTKVCLTGSMDGKIRVSTLLNQ